MPSLTFTAQTIKNLKSDGKQIDYFDTKPVIEGQPGRLGLRISQSGRKSWVLLYRINGKKRRYTFKKSYPTLSLKDVRTKAATKLLAILEGQDPAAEKKRQKQSLTFKELADVYLNRHAKIKKASKSYYEDHRIVNHSDLKPWHDRKAKDISRRDVIRLLDSIADRAPVMANRVKALISKIYNFGIRRDEVEINPAWNTDKPTDETPRDRAYSDDEIKKLWAAFKKVRSGLHGVFELILLTAQRPGEVAGMRKSELEDGKWSLPQERTKNRRPHVVPLSDQAQTIIKATQGNETFVFPAVRNDTCTRVNSLDLRKVRDESGIDDFQAHDLRRTALTNMGKLGVNRFIQDRIANHADSTMGGVYDRYEYLSEKTAALKLWADHLDQIMRVKNPKVVKIQRAVQ